MASLQCYRRARQHRRGAVLIIPVTRCERGCTAAAVVEVLRAEPAHEQPVQPVWAVTRAG